ncbi:hypothetical protein KFE25_007424 [Diacronema lutheri]|uniref:Maltose/galactoside acetyltransferase domain-containing protein n=1 Tax=Diacronema lutheri TaxID=2081491 RepID=A0A8J6CFA2_DIALT|nr:hypothetical protein KFE25_007424 [Diacronema lutheri]
MSRRDLAPSVALALLGAGVAGLGAVACARWRYRATARRRRRLLRVFLARCEEARKMRAGEPYDIREPTVMAVMRVAHTICDEHNAQPLGARPRDEILRDLLGSVDGEMQVEAPFFCDVGAHIHVGRHFHANTGCCMLDVAEIRIGNNVFLAPNVQLRAHRQPERGRRSALARW